MGSKRSQGISGYNLHDGVKQWWTKGTMCVSTDKKLSLPSYKTLLVYESLYIPLGVYMGRKGYGADVDITE